VPFQYRRTMSERRDPGDDPAVRAGMERLLARREELLGAGARPLGWKLALGTEAALESLGLSGPLVGFLTDATLVESGGEVGVGGWRVAKLEPEIAIHLGAGGERVAAVAAAFELADVDRPPSETEEVLAGDIYHRAVVFGEPVSRPEEPLALTIERDGERFAAVDDAEAVVGRLEDLVAYVSRYLERFGAESREGEIVISGSTVPLIDVAAGEAWTSSVEGVGDVAVRLV
jgi:2-keto-4-pentenoate hydratase